MSGAAIDGYRLAALILILFILLVILLLACF